MTSDTSNLEARDVPLTNTLERSRLQVHAIVHYPEVPSTNDLLAALWERVDHRLVPFTTIVTDNQTAGHGRLGREWTTPADTCLTASTLLAFPDEERGCPAMSLVPLITAEAVRNAILAVAPGADVAVKWPNDVLLNGKKVAGLLGQVLDPSDGSAWCLIGYGVNLTIPAEELPTDFATSLVASGAVDAETADFRELQDRILASVLENLRTVLFRLARNHFDVERAGLMDQIRSHSATIGQPVIAHLTDGDVEATALDITDRGELTVKTPDGADLTVTAADVDIISIPKN